MATTRTAGLGKNRSDGIEPSQRPFVGPVQVLEQHQHRCLTAELAEVLAERLGALVAQRLWLGGQVEAAVMDVESEPGADQGCLAWPGLRPDSGDEAVDQPLAYDVGRVVDRDVQP